MDKKWILAKKVSEDFINKFPEFPPVILQLLYNRGLSLPEEIEDFLNPDYEKNVLNPFLFQEMEKAVKRIFLAIQKKEKIVIHGDYDADGVCSAVILYETLKNLSAEIEVYLPHREREGYGLNKNTISEFAKKRISLIITTDCGISNKEEVALAKTFKIDVIITDHHEPPANLPSAYAIINPHLKGETYPFKDLAGSGVAFKLATALIKKAKDFTNQVFPEGAEKWLLDLVAISTVTDIVPLRGENRTLVKYGLMVLAKTRREGLISLFKISWILKEKIDTHMIGFQIGPRLNAAGRMDHANLAFKLLTATSKEEAQVLAKKLHLNNQVRQKTTENLVQEVKEKLGDFEESQKILFAVGEEWPVGIIGLVAGKISDEFYRPTLVISKKEGKLVGSGRSIREFNIIKALEKTQVYFERWGGHAQACGFTLKRVELIEEFYSDLTEIVEKELGKVKLTPVLEIDAEINLEDVTWEFFEILERFNPFGEANPKPLFVIKKAMVIRWQKVGESGQHLKLIVSQGNSNQVRKTIGFGLGFFTDNLKEGDLVDFVFEVGVNEWNGSRELELKIIDIKKVKVKSNYDR